jgi:hypothetical protein
MTEVEWLASTDPTPMLEFLCQKAIDRKLYLFVSACCRRGWNPLSDERSRLRVDIAERWADEGVSFEGWDPNWRSRLRNSRAAGSESALDPEMLAHVVLLSDVFGNPFRRTALDPAWRTPTVVALATAAYEDRIMPAGHLHPDHLAVLADALEDTGCDNVDLLSHLRGPGPHVRGCWVIDLLLGKE